MEIQFKNIVKKYGSFCAVDNLNLTIASGALHFLLGPSGCGKTTSLRILAGLEEPTSGQILMGGKDVTKSSPQDRGIGMVFQNYALWPHMTVFKNIEYGLKLRKMSDEERADRIRDVLKITQLDRFLDRYPGQLSGGQQQRVALARALAVRPNALLLDEPLSNLDAKLRLEMRDNICRIHQETGITTLYVTHDQKEALSMGTMISVMYSGLLMQTANPRIIYNRPIDTFVAGFIGEANIVNGKILSLGSKSDTHRFANVTSPWGEFKGILADESLELKAGDECALIMRPEAFTVDFKGAGLAHDNQVNAILRGDTYLGELEQFLLDAEGHSLRVTAFHAPMHNKAPGDTLRCGIDSADVLILPRSHNLGQGT